MSVTPNTPGVQSYLVPLVNTPQTFLLPLSGVTYTMTCKWNDMGQFWALDIADSNATMIVANVPLITGADCLQGLDYLDFGGSLYVLTSGAHPDDVPTLANLGIDSFLYFLSVSSQ